ncbi:hypothetical protein [Teredinibacter turnerae]|uniref:hypothetical protein n=1 Tax=Teredinibacter turnerae TaxID=2426 RepID=UPI000A48DAB9|nr:hypothetical protein [Teredinibacter turnerae]
MLDKVKRAWRDNVDTRIVVSSALGAAVLGGMTFLAVRSGVKPIAAAAKVAKNGSAK